MCTIISKMDEDEKTVQESLDTISHNARELTNEEKEILAHQDTRLVSDFKANKLEIDAKKNWDLFYKRNDTRGFKDRHWTTREFNELLGESSSQSEIKNMLEIGCGVGNLVYPLIEENVNNYYIYACDLSDRAVDLVKCNPMYNENIIKAFQCDITTKSIFNNLERNTIDVATLVFVLSSIQPDKFQNTLENIYNVVKPGGVLLFRDYGLYDMAQLRFKAGNKIAENLYVRQDGTRSYYFSEEFLERLATSVGFSVISNMYVNRRTINQKFNIDVPRTFIQAKLRKPDT